MKLRDELRRTGAAGLAGLLIAVTVMLAACASIAPDFNATPSYAFADVRATRLARAHVAPQAQHPGLSGFRLINNGVSALMTRAALADVAEKSIDIQYYIFDAHPIFEIRLFNPFPERARWTRTLQLVLNLGTLGNRIHNKVFAVDAIAAVMGGRNVSNRYFEGWAEANFRDMDLLAAPAENDHGLRFEALRSAAAT